MNWKKIKKSIKNLINWEPINWNGAKGYGFKASWFDGSRKGGATDIRETPDPQRGCSGCWGKEGSG